MVERRSTSAPERCLLLKANAQIMCGWMPPQFLREVFRKERAHWADLALKPQERGGLMTALLDFKSPDIDEVAGLPPG